MSERVVDRPTDADPSRDRKPSVELVQEVGRELEVAMAVREPDLPRFEPPVEGGKFLFEAQVERFGAVAGLEAIHARDEAAIWRFSDDESTAILIHEAQAERSDHTELIIIRPLTEGEFGPGESTHVRLRYGVFHDPSVGHDGEAFVDNGSTFGKLDKHGRFQWVHVPPGAPEEAWASNLHDAQPSEEGGDWGATVAELNAAQRLVRELSGAGA